MTALPYRKPKPGDLWAYKESNWRVLVLHESASYAGDEGFTVVEWNISDLQESITHRRWSGWIAGFWELLAESKMK